MMKVTKYPQSCLVLEKGSARILLDPGTVATNAYALEDFGDVGAVLYTHRHADHFDDQQVTPLLERGVRLYGNADVCSLIGSDATEVRDGEELEIAGFQVTPRDLPHCPMVDGSEGPPNTGFVFDGRLFHPGDGINLAGLSAELLALPIAGPSISFREAYAFVQQTGARTVVPIHYDVFLGDPETFAQSCDVAEVVVLRDGESAEL
jgi:L-ascorbate metabolism protein UlaG (beta-lactamase superfamily)